MSITRKIVIALILFIVAVNSLRAVQIFATSDEMDHLAYGLKILQGNSDRIERQEQSKMPISALNGVFALGEMTVLAIMRGKALTAEGLREVWDEEIKSKRYYVLKAARFFTIICSVLLALLIYAWTKQLYGEKAGLFSLFLYAFSPTILGHSSLVTNDLPNAFTMTLALYCLWHLLKEDSTQNRIMGAATFAISQCVKYTSVFLFPIFILLTLWKKWGTIWSVKPSLLLKKTFTVTGIYLVVLLLTLNAAWLFNGSFKKLGDITLYSTFFKTIQETVPALPMPVPYPYVVGVDHVKDHDEFGEKSTPAYLMGEVRNEGFTGYYFWCMLYKEPIAFLIILGISFYLLFANRRKLNVSDEGFLLIPLLFLLIFFNFLFHRQIGIRFILCVYPLLFIFCGKVFVDWDNKKPMFKGILLGLMAWLAISTTSWHPYYSSHFNELIGERTNAYKYLADSNLDWNQNFTAVDEFLAKYPEAIVSPKKPTTGLVLVRANELAGLFAPRERYQWLRENHQPIGHIGYETLIFNVKKIKETSTGNKEGL